MAPYTLERAHAVQPVTAVQNEYSLWTRLPELGMIQLCARLGVGFVAFSPLARRVFGAPILNPASLPEGEFRTRIPRFRPENWPHNLLKLQEFHAFARARGHEPAAMALAWVLDRAAHIIPIPGTRTPTHLATGSARPGSTWTTTTARASTASCPSAGPGATATTTPRPPASNAIADAGNPAARPRAVARRRRSARSPARRNGPVASDKPASG
ncbi:hypothetical protein MASR1M65_04360 [Saprospiraceae bacterium]